MNMLKEEYIMKFDLINNKIFNNRKKWIIIVSIIVIFILLITLLFILITSNNKNSYTTLTSSDQKFSIELPNNIKYRQNSVPNNDFTIDLYSENDEMFMYATTITKTHELDLYEIATNDKIAYFKDKENLRNDSRYFRNKDK